MTVIEGEASLIDANTVEIHHNEQIERRMGFKHLILATGSRPIEISALPFGGRILSSTEVLSLADIPKSLVVVGGGYIGVELGQMFARFGTAVTILEGVDRFYPDLKQSLLHLSFVN